MILILYNKNLMINQQLWIKDKKIKAFTLFKNKFQIKKKIKKFLYNLIEIHLNRNLNYFRRMMI